MQEEKKENADADATLCNDPRCRCSLAKLPEDAPESVLHVEQLFGLAVDYRRISNVTGKFLI
jgi:hypothetical protein